MAEGFLKSFDSTLDVYSAGTNPAEKVSQKAVMVMKEKGVDISGGRPENVDRYVRDSFDYVITVCDNARETCPVFLGKVKEKLHLGFEDPAEAKGSDEEVLSFYRRIRDEIETAFSDFYEVNIKQGGNE